jgi:uncharacterized protein
MASMERVVSAEADAAAPADASVPVQVLDFAGTWLGTLEIPPAPIRVVLNLESDGGGAWAGTVDSPDQGAIGIPISSVEVVGDRIYVQVDGIGLEYAGQLSADGRTLTGTLYQGGATLPLTLERLPGPLDYSRAQDPRPPFPYNTAEVTFASDEAGIMLAGTLSWPEGPGPFKTVALITGSGAQNRNEELANHRPFLVLSDALTRAGVAVLRYDDRGVGGSSGDHATATSENFAADARGAVRFLRAQIDVAVDTIGLVGHSEGGLIAPLVAAGNADVGFLVLLAGPAVDGKTILISQGRAIAGADGASLAAMDAYEARQRALFACFDPPDATDAAIDMCLLRVVAGLGLSQAEMASTLAQLGTPWMRWFLTYDPAPVLRRTLLPVLALNGSLDLQVLPSVNLPVMEAALAEAGNAQATVRELAGLNHLFQHAVTGSPREYATLSETMAPEVPTQIAEWIGALSDTADGDAADAGL